MKEIISKKEILLVSTLMFAGTALSEIVHESNSKALKVT
jgi:hypothetical protein